MSCYYKNDAEKSTKDFKMGLQQVEEKLSNEMLKEYILALVKSKYANFKELYEILLMDLNEEQLNDIWKAVVEQNSEAYTFAKVFEKLSNTREKNRICYLDGCENKNCRLRTNLIIPFVSRK